MKCNYARPPLFLVYNVNKLEDCYERKDYVGYFYWLNKLYITIERLNQRYKGYRTWGISIYTFSRIRYGFIQLFKGNFMALELFHKNTIPDMKKTIGEERLWWI